MAAFTAADPSDREAFSRRWARILADDGVVKRTILVAGEVAGHVACFERDGVPEVTYWVARSFWGRGVATAALGALLREHAPRPLYARVAADNAASRRVLEKSGFVAVGRERGFAPGRGEETDELVLELD